MNVTGLLGLFCGVAVMLAVLLTAYFLSIDTSNRRGNRWLGLLFLAVALRLGKSIGYFILYDVAAIWVAIGFLGLASTGPLLWAYMHAQRGRPLSRWSAWHGLLALVGAVAIVWNDGEGATEWYQITTVLLLGYIVGSVLWLRSQQPAKEADAWELPVLLSIGVVWVAYVGQHLSETMQGYAWGAVVAAVPLYLLMVQVIRQGVKPKRAVVADAVPAALVAQVREALEVERAYLERNLTLNQFASTLDIPAYRITQVVQQAYHKTFPEVVNALRIRAAQRQLTTNPEAFIKMEVLAQEVGFNSPSAFYAAFKKETGSTPKAYQKAQLATRSSANLLST